jgi:hypothetical protein
MPWIAKTWHHVRVRLLQCTKKGRCVHRSRRQSTATITGAFSLHARQLQVTRVSLHSLLSIHSIQLCMLTSFGCCVRASNTWNWASKQHTTNLFIGMSFRSNCTPHTPFCTFASHRICNAQARYNDVVRQSGVLRMCVALHSWLQQKYDIYAA